MKNTIIPGYTKTKRSSMPLFNNKGELNASSKADAILALGEVLDVIRQNNVSPEAEEASRDEYRRERGKALVEAVTDKSGNKMAVLAEAVTSEVLDQTNRDGFCRRFLQHKELSQGDIPYVTLKDKQALAYAMSSASRVIPVEIRERRQILNEFHITGQINISNIEIARSSTDLLEEKYDETLEAIMVQEDRFWKKLADRAALSRNNLQTFLQLTPQFFAKMMAMITNKGLPVQHAIISTNLMQDIIAGSEFTQVFDPVTQWEVLQTGEMGSLYNVQITSDATRDPGMRVLEPGDFYMVSSPEFHGVLHTRPIITEPINGYNRGKSERGWFVDQITSMIVGNNKSVAKGKRLGN